MVEEWEGLSRNFADVKQSIEMLLNKNGFCNTAKNFIFIRSVHSINLCVIACSFSNRIKELST